VCTVVLSFDLVVSEIPEARLGEEDMWEEMKAQFDGRTISDGELLKPMAGRADDVLAPLLGLDEEQVEWVKDYDTEFGRAP
jgi:hypothetical protein